MQYEYIGGEIAISIHILQTLSIDIGKDQLRLYYRISCHLNTAGD